MQCGQLIDCLPSELFARTFVVEPLLARNQFAVLVGHSLMGEGRQTQPCVDPKLSIVIAIHIQKLLFFTSETGPQAQR